MFTKRKIYVVLAISILFLVASNPRAWSTTALASFSDQRTAPNPVTIPYPGRLSDSNGQPVADGVYAFAFDLYDTEADGQSMWSEVQEGVMVKDGAFTTSLGSVNPIPMALLDGRALWLSTSVHGPGETQFIALTPRQRVSPDSLAAPSNATAAGTCPHDHVGEEWSANIPWSNGALKVLNYANGPSIWGWNGGNGNGIRGYATGTGLGVYGESENSGGVVGRSATGYGVEGVSTSGSAGIWAHSTSGYGLLANSSDNDSIRVTGAGKNGVRVDSSGDHGVYVASAGWSGVAVWSANVAGVWVNSAGQDGILVSTAGWDGVHVVGPVGGVYYGSGKKGDEDFAVLNTGEVRSKVGFASPANDFAVMMNVLGAKSDYEPGDVLVIRGEQGLLAGLGASSYATTVIGVYTAAPGFLGGQAVTSQADGIPVAVMGIVSVKVSAENGPIHPGDLLVTSSTPGYAMRGDNPPPGTILGKALGSLDSGSGVVLVLITLQ
jgi:hypothetical protein